MAANTDAEIAHALLERLRVEDKLAEGLRCEILNGELLIHGSPPTDADMSWALLGHLEAEGKLDEELRYEILHGELVIRGTPGTRHGEVVSVLGRRLRSWAVEHGGQAVVDAALQIGDQQPVPDLALVGSGRGENHVLDGFHVPPDLVIEVTSPGTCSLDLNEKRDVYVDIGVPEYWVVDLEREVVVVYRRGPSGAFETTELAEGTLATDLAPGLEIPVAELFPGHVGRGSASH